MTGALATLRAEKEGRLDRGQGGRNGLAMWDCRGQQGPKEQVEGVNTESLGQAVEAGSNGRVFVQAVQDYNEGVKLGAKSGAA